MVTGGTGNRHIFINSGLSHLSEATLSLRNSFSGSMTSDVLWTRDEEED